MKHQSVWTATAQMPQFESLKENIKTDVLIVGGGLCGILCAHLLSRAGIDCVVVEANRAGLGITKNTTAKITAQHGLIYDNLLRTAGPDAAMQYFWANQKAVEQYRDICKNIDCDFENKSAFVYSRTDREKIEREVVAVRMLGFQAEFKETLPLPFPVKGAVEFPNQAQFHPLKFLKAVVKNLRIYENTFIKDISEHTAWSEKGSVTADKIIVTSHFPFINKHGSYFLKMYQQRSYVLALKNAQDVGGMYLDEAENGLSFRNYNDLLFLGGGGHRTGKQGGNWAELRAFDKKHYPDAEECYAWAAQDCMSLDTVPYIGHYSKKTPNLFVATGFNKWGMTASLAAAEILTDMVQGKENEFAKFFSPHRSIVRPQLFVNGFEAVKNLLTPTLRRCPHLGCALKWNRAEHTWDCPCHGSRFRENGDLIDNPATGGAKIE